MLAETQLVMCGDTPVQRQTEEEEIFYVSSILEYFSVIFFLMFLSCCELSTDWRYKEKVCFS